MLETTIENFTIRNPKTSPSILLKITDVKVPRMNDAPYNKAI